MMYRTILFFTLWCAFTLPGISQQPSGIFYFDKTIITEKMLTDSEGRTIGIQKYTARNMAGSGITLNSTGQNILIKGGKESEATLCNYRLESSILWISMGKGKDNCDVSLDYPTNPTAGLNRTHGLEFSVTTRLAGINKKIDCKIDNRRILARNERIVTGRGAWECIKTGYDMELKCFGIPYRIYVIEWFAPDTGIVRTDILRNGRLYERRLLCDFRMAVL